MRSAAVAWAFLRRDVAVLRSYRFPLVFDTVFGVLNLAVYFFLSRTFGEVGPEELNGAPTYFAFAAVGAILALVVESATEGVADKVRDGQISGSLENLLTHPITTPQLCAGLVAFPFAFAVLRSLLYMVIALLLMDLELAAVDWLGFVVVLLLTGTSLAVLGIITGAVILVYKRGQAISGVGLFAMGLISGAVFPVSALPGWLEAIGRAMPLRFSFDGARDALFLGSGWLADAGALLLLTAVGLPAGLLVFHRAVDTCRRRGSLGQY